MEFTLITHPSFGFGSIKCKVESKKICLFRQVCELDNLKRHFFWQTQGKPFGKLRASPSANSGQALRQTQGKPFGKLRASFEICILFF
jgi:hypothetical protein